MKTRSVLTGVFQVVRHVDAAIRRGLIGEVVCDRVGFVCADHLACKSSQFGSDLLGCKIGGGDVIVLLLCIEELQYIKVIRDIIL